MEASLQLQIKELVLERPSLHCVDARVATTCRSESVSGGGRERELASVSK